MQNINNNSFMIKLSMPMHCKGTSFLVASVIFSVFSDARAGVVSGDDTVNSGMVRTWRVRSATVCFYFSNSIDMIT